MSPLVIPKPRILSEIPLDRHAVIEASAGTGKTFTLESLLVELVLAGAPIQSILVVTFTEKATAELRRRLRAKLQAMVRGEGAVEGPVNGPAWVIDAEARARLDSALLDLDAASVSTIHAFCQRALTEQAFLNQRLFGEQAVDGGLTFTRMFTHLLRTELARDAELQSYLEAWLTAGQGLDELRALLWRVQACGAATIAPEYRPDRLEAVLERLPIELLDGARLRSALEGTSVRALRAPWLPKVVEGLAALRPLIERARGAKHGLASLLRELDALEETWAPKLRGEAGTLLAMVSSRLAEAAAVAPELTPLSEALRGLAVETPSLEAAIVSRYLPLITAALDREKRERGVFDFDDMLRLLDRALNQGPHAELLAQALRRRFRYGLIDEFQDTDAVQWRIFRRIFFEGRAAGLYVIGDPKQAIYGFRGADVHTYLEAKKEILAAGGARVSLTENFRSTPRLIAAYNRILDQAAIDPIFSGPITYDAPVVAGRRGLSLRDAQGNEPSPVHLFHPVARRPGQKPGTPEIREAIAGRIAQEIERLLAPDRAWTLVDPERPDPPEPIRAGDIHVLSRSGLDGTVVGAALRARRIPHAFFKQDGLLQTAEAAAIRDLLAAVVEPSHRSKRYRAWLTPFFDVGIEDLGTLADVPPAHPLLRFLYEWKAIADARDYGLLFNRIIEDSGLVRRELFFRRGERALTNYLHLFEVLLESAVHERPTLAELVSKLHAMIEGRALPVGENPNVQRLETERDAVQIMTIHKAKGLEAAVVFVIGGFWSPTTERLPYRHHLGGQRTIDLRRKRRLPPEVAAAVDREEDEDVQRLLYVALTRAKGRLYLPQVGGGLVRGDYLRLDRRLEQLINERVLDEVDPLFTSEDVAIGAAPVLRVVEGGAAETEREVSPASLESPDSALDQRVRELARSQLGFTITSYSRLKSQATGSELGAEAVEDVVAEPELGTARELAPTELPPGTATGVFVHELLERVPIASFAGAPDLASFAARPETSALIKEGLLAHNIEERFAGDAARMLHRAYRTPIVLGESGVIDGLASADRVVREMEFLYPMPEASHLRLGALREGARRGRVTIGRGYVKGFVDLVFEHQGRVFFADWKTDLLADYAPAALERYVDESYLLQIKLYSLAFVRLLEIERPAEHESRFGGVLYCFLRGMRAPGEGVLFRRPSWDQLLTWEEELIRGEASARPKMVSSVGTPPAIQTPAPIVWQRTFGFEGLPEETPSGRPRRKRRGGST
ncbi:MAG: UvrD-helicase domain-containing protein [Deltaproteobacteria bacterium]|nr:UvrD-helicase domain-containing protein [Deltaproteobacteria bacterium]